MQNINLRWRKLWAAIIIWWCLCWESGARKLFVDYLCNGRLRNQKRSCHTILMEKLYDLYKICFTFFDRWTQSKTYSVQSRSFRSVKWGCHIPEEHYNKCWDIGIWLWCQNTGTAIDGEIITEPEKNMQCHWSSLSSMLQ